MLVLFVKDVRPCWQSDLLEFIRNIVDTIRSKRVSSDGRIKKRNSAQLKSVWSNSQRDNGTNSFNMYSDPNRQQCPRNIDTFGWDENGQQGGINFTTVNWTFCLKRQIYCWQPYYIVTVRALTLM